MMKDSGSIRLEMLDEASLTRQPEEVHLHSLIGGRGQKSSPIEEKGQGADVLGCCECFPSLTRVTSLFFMLILLEAIMTYTPGV